MSTHEDFEDCPLQNIIRDGGMMNIFRTIGCIGDSLASGEFEYWDNGQKGYWDFYEYSWGKQIERITGCVAYNKSTRYRRQNSPVSEREFLKIGKGHVEAK